MGLNMLPFKNYFVFSLIVVLRFISEVEVRASDTLGISHGKTNMNPTVNLEEILSSPHSFEEFEALKKKPEIRSAIAQEIIERHQLPEAPLELFSEGTNIVYSYGDHTVIKIFPPIHFDQFKGDLLVLKHFQGKLSVQTPTVQYEGNIFGWPYIVMTQLDGTLLETLWDTMDLENKKIIIRELGSLIREVHVLPIQGLEEMGCHWEQFITKQIQECVNNHRSKGLPNALLEQLPAYVGSVKSTLSTGEKPVLLLGEYTPMNLLMKKIQGVWHIHGLIDFGDAMLGLPEYDLLGPGAFLIQGDKTLLREFLTSYGYTSNTMAPALSHRLMVLMLLHQYSNLNAQVRIKDWQNKVHTLKDLENLVWGFSIGYVKRSGGK